jgi:transposase
MASIVHCKKGGYTYLYESVSYREQGKPKNKRKLIGKIDPVSGSPVYKPEYILRMKALGTPVTVHRPAGSFSGSEIRSSIIKQYGAFHLYKNIAEQTGLLPILQDIFPQKWRALFDIACFFISSGEAMMYCQDWSKKSECFPADLSSVDISLLLQSLTPREQDEFFTAWGAYRSEREYLALDITSISSYSELIGTAEWGYNRDGENLPQVNLCLLLGETSRLPVFQTLYSGSLKDVSTLQTTLSMAYAMNMKKLTLVMDKGFYSRKNVRFLLENPEKSRFLISVPFTVKAAKELIKEVKDEIDQPRYAIALSERESIQGVMKKVVWDTGHTVYVHVYYNMVKAVEMKNAVYGYAASLVKLAELNPEDPRYLEEYRKYLKIRKSEKTGRYRIDIRREVLEGGEYELSGWMVLLSGHIKDSEEALMIYREKDVVEKGFYRLKNDLELHRLRIHSGTAMHGKVFICFIALILLSHIHSVMVKKKMYKYWTMKELIKYLDQIILQDISGNRILYPLTKKQKDIYRAFDVEIPV